MSILGLQPEIKIRYAMADISPQQRAVAVGTFIDILGRWGIGVNPLTFVICNIFIVRQPWMCSGDSMEIRWWIRRVTGETVESIERAALDTRGVEQCGLHENKSFFRGSRTLC